MDTKLLFKLVMCFILLMIIQVDYVDVVKHFQNNIIAAYCAYLIQEPEPL